MDVELCDDSQSALATYEELFEVVTRVVFHNFRAEVQNFSVRSHSLESQNMRAERPIFDDVLSSSVCGSIASDLTRALRSQVQRSLEAFLLKKLVELLENDSRLY